MYAAFTLCLYLILTKTLGSRYYYSASFGGISQFYRWGNWCTEWLTNLSRATQLVSSAGRIYTSVIRLQSLYFKPVQNILFYMTRDRWRWGAPNWEIMISLVWIGWVEVDHGASKQKVQNWLSGNIHLLVMKVRGSVKVRRISSGDKRAKAPGLSELKELEESWGGIKARKEWWAAEENHPFIRCLGSYARQDATEVRNVLENARRLKTENSLLDFEQKSNRIISKEK